MGPPPSPPPSSSGPSAPPCTAASSELPLEQLGRMVNMYQNLRRRHSKTVPRNSEKRSLGWLRMLRPIISHQEVQYESLPYHNDHHNHYNYHNDHNHYNHHNNDGGGQGGGF